MEEFDRFGVWYLPVHPEIQVGGRLQFHRGSGITLDLLADEESAGALFSVASHQIIIGVTQDGKEMSLVECREINRGYRASMSVAHRTFLVSVAYFGVLFENLDEIRFSAVALNYDVLNLWARRDNRFAVSTASDGAKRTFTYEPDIALKAQTVHGEVSLAYGLSESHSADELRLQRVPRFGGFPNESETLDELLKFFHFPLQTLLTLSARQAVELIDISVRFDFRAEDGEPATPIWLNVCLDTVIVGSASATPSLRFTAADFSTEFESWIPEWFKIADRLEPLIHIWHAAHAAKRSFVEQKFQYAVAAAEGLHTARKPKLGRSVADLDDPIAREVVAEYRGKRRRWLLEKLSPAPLRKRLLSLAEPQVFEGFFKTNEHRHAAMRAIVANRNHLAHGTLLAPADKLTGEQLHWATDFVLLLAEWELLALIGVDPSTAADWFRRDPEFEHTARRFIRTVG